LETSAAFVVAITIGVSLLCWLRLYPTMYELSYFPTGVAAGSGTVVFLVLALRDRRLRRTES